MSTANAAPDNAAPANPVPRKKVKNSPFLDSGEKGVNNLKEIFNLVIKYCQEVTALT